MSFSAGYKKFEPVATPKTRYRLVGPLAINGMHIWRIFTIGKGGKGGEQVGPDYFGYQAAVDELKALVAGRRSFYFNGVPFEKKNL